MASLTLQGLSSLEKRKQNKEKDWKKRVARIGKGWKVRAAGGEKGKLQHWEWSCFLIEAQPHLYSPGVALDIFLLVLNLLQLPHVAKDLGIGHE